MGRTLPVPRKERRKEGKRGISPRTKNEFGQLCTSTVHMSKYVNMTSVDKKEKTMCLHYNLPHHSKAYFRAQIIKKVSPCTTIYLLEREDYWIRTLDTKSPRESTYMTRSTVFNFLFWTPTLLTTWTFTLTFTFTFTSKWRKSARTILHKLKPKTAFYLII